MKPIIFSLLLLLLVGCETVDMAENPIVMSKSIYGDKYRYKVWSTKGDFSYECIILTRQELNVGDTLKLR
jgi:hypothetical protein